MRNKDANEFCILFATKSANGLRLKKRAEVEPRVYGSRWASLLASGQWLLFFDASAQARLEQVLPAGEAEVDDARPDVAGHHPLE